MKPNTPEDYDGDVYVINQKDPRTGKFDEPKAYIGYATAQEAELAYRNNYADDWQGFDGVTQVPMAKFKEMLNDEQAFMKPVKTTLREQIAERKADEVSEQFNSYRAWIEKGNTVSKGMIETIKMDERLNDGEADKLLAMVPQQEQTIETNKTPQQSITKEETEGLFGLPAKREKALKRIAEGRGWFGAQDKAKEFVRLNRLSDTHEVMKGSGLRWEIVPKESKNIIQQAKGMGKLQIIPVTDKPKQKTELEELKDLRANLSEQLQAQGTVTDARLEDRLAQVNRAIQEIENKQAEPVNDEKSKAKADFDSALGDLGDIFGKNLRSNITPEQEQKLIPVLR